MSEAIYDWQAGFFAALPVTLRQSVLAAAVARTFKDGDVINRRGDHDRALAVVRTGAVRLANIGRDGREITLVTLQPGESFGEFTVFAGLPRQFDATACGETVVDRIDRKSVDTLLLNSPILSQHVIKHLSQRLHEALVLLDDERRLPLVARLARRLLQWSAAGENKNLVVATQQEIADELAVSRVALSGAIRHLVADDLIETGYGRLHLKDRRRLESWVAAKSELSPV